MRKTVVEDWEVFNELAERRAANPSDPVLLRQMAGAATARANAAPPPGGRPWRIVEVPLGRDEPPPPPVGRVEPTPSVQREIADRAAPAVEAALSGPWGKVDRVGGSAPSSAPSGMAQPTSPDRPAGTTVDGMVRAVIDGDPAARRTGRPNTPSRADSAPSWWKTVRASADPSVAKPTPRTPTSPVRPLAALEEFCMAVVRVVVGIGVAVGFAILLSVIIGVLSGTLKGVSPSPGTNTATAPADRAPAPRAPAPSVAAPPASPMPSPVENPSPQPAPSLSPATRATLDRMFGQPVAGDPR